MPRASFNMVIQMVAAIVVGLLVFSNIGAAASSYGFSTLIGSVFNQGIPLGVLQNTKTLQSSTTYAFPESTSTALGSSTASPYTSSGYVPISTSISSFNGGGVSFTSFTTGSNDNLLRISTNQLSSLLSNYGTNSETEYLYLTGFPVYDQQSGTNNFKLIDAGGAYEVIFNKPIQNLTSGVPISLLGQNYNIIGGTGATSSVTSTTSSAGGSLALQGPSSTYYTLINNHQIPFGTGGYYVNLLWTNVTGGTKANALYGIIFYNSTPTALAPGQSYSFVQSPNAAYSVTFVGDTLGNNYDPVTLQLSTVSGANYADSASGGGTYITNITEPAQVLTVTSQIPSAFSYAGQTSSTVTYDLTPYAMTGLSNTSGLSASSYASNVVLTYIDPTHSAGSPTSWISGSMPLQVTIIGYSQLTQTYVQESATFTQNTTPSGSRATTLQPMPGTACFETSTFPPFFCSFFVEASMFLTET